MESPPDLGDLADAIALRSPQRALHQAGGDWNQHLYGGLITTLMRLVFMLYAEDEGIMPNDPVYQQYYSVSGLYEQLRSDNSSYPDTMDDSPGGEASPTLWGLGWLIESISADL
jgi:hypothetical protein